MKKLIFLLIASMTLCLTACDQDDDDMTTTGQGDPKPTPVCDGSMPTYDGVIRGIINGNCTNSSCHGSGSNNGIFTSYEGMSEVIADDSFNSRVLVSQNMPQGGSLSQEELNTIKCWVDNGYPEN